MTRYLQSTDLDVWDVIEDGLTFPTKLVDGVLVPKPKQEWNELNRRNFQLNVKAIFTLQEIETIVEMITRFIDIVNGLEALGKTYKESKKVMKILRSLMTYEIKLTKKLQKGEDKKNKSIALKATTKEEEDVEEEKPSDEDDDLALITRKLNKYMREKRDLTCFKCKKLGHIKYDCHLYKSEAKRRRKKAMMATWSESEESSEEENEKEVANMCFVAIDDLDEGSKKDKWFLDSGCSRHMTGDESKFAFLTKRKGGYVTFGDNSKGRIIGQGNIGNGTSSLIESVLLVDGLKHNLLSTSQLCDKGFKVIFEASHCIIKDIQNDKTIFMGHKCDNVYAINISKDDGHDRCFSSMHDQSWLWHRSLGHADMDLISQLNKDELESLHVIFDESNNSLQERESFDDDLGLETSMGKLQIEDRRQQEEVAEDPKKEESPLALPPPQQVQGESSQDLPKDWKFVINHP
ncbi:hypothetical protein CK203_039084 [Vitis vinifera]|uniref:CCHC-type domain-containing protein n=1 Tax=Vitis vinifera TaxID=29760 RepID=A0A438IFS1_VITVI|nr:hypothetical protein CK203_039084 [Vitis vinifera]